MQVLVTLNSGQGVNLGPNFTLSVNNGTITPNTATITELLLGKLVTVDTATQITITSIGDCTNSLILNIISATTTTTTTTTTAAPTTTTTAAPTTTTTAAPTTTTTAAPTTTTTSAPTTTTTTTAPICSSYEITNSAIDARNPTWLDCDNVSQSVTLDPSETITICAYSITDTQGCIVTNLGPCPTTSTTTTTTAAPTTTTTTQQTVWYNLTKCADGTSAVSIGYIIGTFVTNQLVVDAGTPYTILSQVTTNPGGTQLVITSVGGALGCPTTTTTTTTAAPTTTTTTQQTVWYNLTKCADGTSAVSIGYIIGTFVTNQLVVNVGISYTILNYVTTDPGGTQLIISSVGGALGCPTTTTTTLAPTTTTTTTTTVAPTTTTTIAGYTVNVYAQRSGLATGPIVYIYRSTDGVNFVTSGVTVNRTPGALMYTLTIPSGTTLYLQQVNTQTSVASSVTATAQLNSYPASATGGNCTNTYTITSATNIYLFVSVNDACIP